MKANFEPLCDSLSRKCQWKRFSYLAERQKRRCQMIGDLLRREMGSGWVLASK